MNLEITPAFVAGFPDEVLQDEALVKEIESNVRFIREQETGGRRQKRITVRINSLNGNEIESKLSDIFSNQTKAFKISLSFSFILRNVNDESLRFFYGSFNNTLLEKPFVVSDRAGFDRLIALLRDTDILESVRQQRPNSKWVFHLITNMVTTLDFLRFPNRLSRFFTRQYFETSFHHRTCSFKYRLSRTISHFTNDHNF